jgi:hypothetical protein
MPAPGRAAEPEPTIPDIGSAEIGRSGCGRIRFVPDGRGCDGMPDARRWPPAFPGSGRGLLSAARAAPGRASDASCEAPEDGGTDFGGIGAGLGGIECCGPAGPLVGGGCVAPRGRTGQPGRAVGMRARSPAGGGTGVLGGAGFEDIGRPVDGAGARGRTGSFPSPPGGVVREFTDLSPRRPLSCNHRCPCPADSSTMFAVFRPTCH